MSARTISTSSSIDAMQSAIRRSSRSAMTTAVRVIPLSTAASSTWLVAIPFSLVLFVCPRASPRLGVRLSVRVRGRSSPRLSVRSCGRAPGSVRVRVSVRVRGRVAAAGVPRPSAGGVLVIASAP
ncbi:hypothetical protein [Streptomyces sp. M18.1]